jgi:hypothetical protein
VLFASPIATHPSAWTAIAVAIEASDSATEAYTPPWSSPAGCSSSGRTLTRPRTSLSDQPSSSRP